MQKNELIQKAVETANHHGYKGNILVTEDGNVFLQRNQEDIAYCANHVRTSLQNGKEQRIYQVNNTETEVTCVVITVDELIKQKAKAPEANGVTGTVITPEEEMQLAQLKIAEAPVKAEKEGEVEGGEFGAQSDPTDKKDDNENTGGDVADDLNKRTSELIAGLKTMEEKDAIAVIAASTDNEVLMKLQTRVGLGKALKAAASTRILELAQEQPK